MFAFLNKFLATVLVGAGLLAVPSIGLYVVYDDNALANTEDVKLTISDLQGNVITTIDLTSVSNTSQTSISLENVSYDYLTNTTSANRSIVLSATVTNSGGNGNVVDVQFPGPDGEPTTELQVDLDQDSEPQVVVIQKLKSNASIGLVGPAGTVFPDINNAAQFVGNGGSHDLTTELNGLVIL